MHILLRYYESHGATRQEKVRDTLETMGPSILVGGLSTMLGVLPLAFSTNEVAKVVFTSFIAMVTLGFAHGLIFLPVVLSILGPNNTHTANSTHSNKNIVKEDDSKHSNIDGSWAMRTIFVESTNIVAEDFDSNIDRAPYNDTDKGMAPPPARIRRQTSDTVVTKRSKSGGSEASSKQSDDSSSASSCKVRAAGADEDGVSPPDKPILGSDATLLRRRKAGA